ncbi:MAG TPA: hypothetical protein VGO53_01770, partial [Steroidobacteraceae bacterium]|nr:hypothetical protein [Steroidobacteraceae bacterium]
MNTPATRTVVQALLLAICLLCTACATTGRVIEEGEPAAAAVAEATPPPEEIETAVDEKSEEKSEEGEVALAVAETEHREEAPASGELAEVVVAARARDRHDLIHDFVSEAQALLNDVELEYVFTGKGKKEVLRGRPVAFALWSETKMEWSIAHLEIPRPPVKWKPGGRAMPFVVRTQGVAARHVKGTGAERLMFSFSKDGEQMKVYGRKFPVFDAALLAKKRWRAVAETAKPIVYLPFTEDTLDPQFVTGGRDFLLATARKAIAELRLTGAPARAFPGELLADVVPAEVITTLAVIE